MKLKMTKLAAGVEKKTKYDPLTNLRVPHPLPPASVLRFFVLEGTCV